MGHIQSILFCAWMAIRCYYRLIFFFHTKRGGQNKNFILSKIKESTQKKKLFNSHLFSSNEDKICIYWNRHSLPFYRHCGYSNIHVDNFFIAKKKLCTSPFCLVLISTLEKYIPKVSYSIALNCELFKNIIKCFYWVSFVFVLFLLEGMKRRLFYW